MVETSVIVPVYNDPEGIETTLDSLRTQTAPAYEVLVVDNGSTDETSAVIDSIADGTLIRHLTEADIQGSYAARNRGVEAATGEFLCFLDADMWVDDSYVKRITQLMRGEGYDYVGCKVEVVGETGLLGRYVAATAFPVERYLEDEQFAPTCCLTVHRRVVDEVGSFDARLVSGGDMEFGTRVAAAGFDQTYVDEIFVCHPARNSLQSFLAKYVRVGRGRQQLACRYPERFDPHPLWDPRNYAPTMPRPPASRASKPETLTALGTWVCLTWLTKLAIAWGRLLERGGV